MIQITVVMAWRELKNAIKMAWDVKTLVIFGEIAQSFHFFFFLCLRAQQECSSHCSSTSQWTEISTLTSKVDIELWSWRQAGGFWYTNVAAWKLFHFPPNAVAPDSTVYDCMYLGDNGISIVTHTTTSLKPTEVECMFSKSLLFLLLSEHLNHGVGLLAAAARAESTH